MESDSILYQIKGEKLSAVIFVLDYVQLDFDGKKLSCYIFPDVHINSKLLHFPETGYRDSLCRLLGNNVTSISIIKAVGITINFDSDYIHCPLNRSQIGEVFFFTDESNNWESYTDDSAAF
ncbi:MAG TPA: hypothetical protein PLI74_01840 [Candidatus Kapabacteria bacterium]|jgi:hypothetical protein|nr:hypothetical protein [Ignavibacteria bacterium]HRK58356.1 hypothetical protein [Candidatus Kapabacteria bacterium]